MQLTPAQLVAHLQKGLRSLYTLHGDEPLLIQEAADAIRAAARAQAWAWPSTTVGNKPADSARPNRSCNMSSGVAAVQTCCPLVPPGPGTWP